MKHESLTEDEWNELVSLPPNYWCEDAKEVRKFFEEQVIFITILFNKFLNCFFFLGGKRSTKNYL